MIMVMSPCSSSCLAWGLQDPQNKNNKKQTNTNKTRKPPSSIPLFQCQFCFSFSWLVLNSPELSDSFLFLFCFVQSLQLLPEVGMIMSLPKFLKAFKLRHLVFILNLIYCNLNCFNLRIQQCSDTIPVLLDAVDIVPLGCVLFKLPNNNTNFSILCILSQE